MEEAHVLKVLRVLSELHELQSSEYGAPTERDNASFGQCAKNGSPLQVGDVLESQRPPPAVPEEDHELHVASEQRPTLVHHSGILQQNSRSPFEAH